MPDVPSIVLAAEAVKWCEQKAICRHILPHGVLESVGVQALPVISASAALWGIDPVTAEPCLKIAYSPSTEYLGLVVWQVVSAISVAVSSAATTR